MTDKTDIPELRRFNFEIWPHEAYISEQYDGEYVLFSDAHQQIEAANSEIAALKSKDISCTLGVGDGSGRLFVHGDYDSIKATQKIIIERDALKGEQAAVALTVWYGSMPESNGKENWTAILHRKGGNISDGITVDRSEYPERVRYEADRMLYLIVEIQDEPDILTYDANKRSDYVNPLTAKKKPVITKEKLCDWLEDNFDIDDSQRDAFANCFAHHCNCIVKEGE